MHKAITRESSSHSLLQKRYLSPSKQEDEYEPMSKIRQSKRIAQQQKCILASKETESKTQRRSLRNQKAFLMEDDSIRRSYWMDYEIDTSSRAMTQDTMAFTEDLESPNSNSISHLTPVDFAKTEKPNKFKFLLDFSDGSDTREDLEIPEPVLKGYKPALESQIQKYLDVNYMKIFANSSVFLQSRSKIKSYAVKCEKRKAVQMLEFISNQWPLFNKVWILIDNVNDEVAFLFNNLTHSSSEFFNTNFGLACPEFYLLKSGKSTPENHEQFSGHLEGVLLYQYKIPKGEESFLDAFEDFECYCKLNSIHGICDFASIKEELEGLRKENEKERR